MLTLLKTLSDPGTLRAMLIAYRPTLMRAAVIVLGIFIGIYSVYAGLPLVGLKWRNAEPVHLTEGYKDQWVKNTALLYQAGFYSPEQAKAALESAGYGPSEIQALADANANAPDMQRALMSVKDLPSQATADSNRAAISSSFISNLTPFICLFLWFIVFAVGAVLFNLVSPLISTGRRAPESESTVGLSEKERQRREALGAAKEQQVGFAEDAQGPPLATFMSAYVLGDDLYDDSFAIEPDGGFAGECGVGISEIIGVGDPKKVTAFEVWIFDQAEIQTLTYVLMSEHAYNDPSLRAKLAPRGEPVLVAAGKSILLETRSLKMQVRIIDLEYGEGSLPPNSFFNKVTFALAVWQKETVGVPAGAPAPMPPIPPAPTAGSFAPPPPLPQAPSPMPSGGMTPPPSGAPGGFAPLPSSPLPSQPSAPGGMAPLPSSPPPSGQPPAPPGGVRPLPGGPPPSGQPPAPPGGIRPLPSNAPGPLPGAGIPPASGTSQFGAQQPPSPQRRPPDEESYRLSGRPAPDDDPFGDTNQM